MTIGEDKIVQVAEGILAGNIGLIDGARQMVAFRSVPSIKEDDPDIMPFIGLESESDDVPMGDVRRRWVARALKIKDEKRKRLEDHWRDVIQEACRNLVKRFKSSEPNNGVHDSLASSAS